MAKQADGAVTVRCGDTVVLVTVCAAKTPREGVDFLPLTVDYRENTYAAGKIPGGFFRREGRPNEKEVLTSRLIDRPLRPLFPSGWACETVVFGFTNPNTAPVMMSRRIIETSDSTSENPASPPPFTGRGFEFEMG